MPFRAHSHQNYQQSVLTPTTEDSACAIFAVRIAPYHVLLRESIGQLLLKRLFYQPAK